MSVKQHAPPFSTTSEHADAAESQIAFIDSAEVWNFDVDTDGTFEHTVVVARSPTAFYHAVVPYRLPDCGADNVLPYLKIIPANDIFPPFPPDFTQAPLSNADNVFYKQPRLLHYGEQRDHGAEALLREAAIYEKLRKHPHPNLSHYFGCTVSDERITSLVLTRYPMTLEQRVKNPVSLQLIDEWMQQISSGISHLHILNLVHNDLNPYNIMIDDSEAAIIIDFDSSCADGAVLVKAGTPGWSSENMGISRRANDATGISKLRKYLEKTCGLNSSYCEQI